MALSLFEFLEQLIISTVFIKLNQFEKIGSMGKIFIPLGNWLIKSNFQNKKSITFFVIFTFDSGVWLPFTKGNELILKRNQKSNRKKSKFEPVQNFFSRKTKN